ncbi:MAG: DUF485 domain-containing protein [Chthoniobacterales bacterium]
MSPNDPTLPEDLTPLSGAPTDVAPLTGRGPTPAHERTATGEAGAIDWEGIAVTPRFRALLRAKRRFIAPAMLFFLIYYFALPVLVGYCPRLMERKVLGSVNIAYLFALSQFAMAWAVAAAYVVAAGKWDRMATEIRGTIGRR